MTDVKTFHPKVVSELMQLLGHKGTRATLPGFASYLPKRKLTATTEQLAAVYPPATVGAILRLAYRDSDFQVLFDRLYDRPLTDLIPEAPYFTKE